MGSVAVTGAMGWALIGARALLQGFLEESLDKGGHGDAAGHCQHPGGLVHRRGNCHFQLLVCGCFWYCRADQLDTSVIRKSVRTFVQFRPTPSTLAPTATGHVLHQVFGRGVAVGFEGSSACLPGLYGSCIYAGQRG